MHSEEVIKSAKIWSTWIMSAIVEIGHPSDFLSYDQQYDEETYSEEERDVLWYCMNNKPLDYNKLYEKFLNIGSVESIMTLGWNTFAYMYGWWFIDEDYLDQTLEQHECDDCYHAHCLHVFTYVFSDTPYSFKQCHDISHCGFDVVKQTVGIISEYRIDALEHMFSNYKVTPIND